MGASVATFLRNTYPDTLNGLAMPTCEFALRALQSTPAGRQRIGQHMLALATYLGHVSIDSTYWYQEPTPELSVDIAVAGEAYLGGGQP